MSEKVGARLRRHGLQAMTFFLGLRTAGGWVGGKRRCALPTDDGRRIMTLCQSVLREICRITSYNVCYTKLLRKRRMSLLGDEQRTHLVGEVADADAQIRVVAEIA